VPGRGGIQTHYDERDSIIGQGLCLGGATDDAVEQEVATLEPNTRYVLAGWLKVKDAASVRLGVRGHGGKETARVVSGAKWQLATLDFTTGAANTEATLFIAKPGAGSAFADDIGLLPAWKPEPLPKP